MIATLLISILTMGLFALAISRFCKTSTPKKCIPEMGCDSCKSSVKQAPKKQ